MKIIRFIDVRGNLWDTYRTKCGHYYSKHLRGKIFVRCKVKSIATVMNLEPKIIKEILLGEYYESYS